MAPLRPGLLVTCLLLNGCVVPEHRADRDPHRDWWLQRHPEAAAYDAELASLEHREWCKRHWDESCEGW